MVPQLKHEHTSLADDNAREKDVLSMSGTAQTSTASRRTTVTVGNSATVGTRVSTTEDSRVNEFSSVWAVREDVLAVLRAA
jgi:hypothetical protein